MDTDLVVAVSQIATGIATLVVALFLAGQLIMQRKQLDMAHQDAQRELGFSHRTRNEQLTLARITNDSLLDAYLKVSKGDEDASEKEVHKFVSYMRTSYLQMINAWDLGYYGDNVELVKGAFGNLMGSVGERKYYITNGRIIIDTVFQLPKLRELGDIVYEELEGRPVST